MTNEKLAALEREARELGLTEGSTPSGEVQIKEVVKEVKVPGPERVVYKDQPKLEPLEDGKDPDWYTDPPWAAKFRFAMTHPGEKGCLIDGPASAGKSTTPRIWANRYGWNVISVQCCEGMTVEDFIGYRGIDGDGKTYLEKGPVVQWIEKGLAEPDILCILIVEEANLPKPATISKLNTQNDDTGDILMLPDGTPITGPDGKPATKPPNCKIVMVQNISYAGCKPINQAVANRLVPIHATFLPEETERKSIEVQTGFSERHILNRMMVLADEIRKGTDEQNSPLDFDFTTRTLIRWVRYCMAEGIEWGEGFRDIVLDEICEPGNYLRNHVRLAIEAIGRKMDVDNWHALSPTDADPDAIRAAVAGAEAW